MLHVVLGPPCAGKSTFCGEHAADGDVVVDFDKLAQALGSPVPHGSSGAVRECTFAARTAVIEHLLAHPDAINAWIIHSSPSKAQMEAYDAVGADIVLMDTDMDTCLARAVDDGRPPGTEDEIRKWFDRNAPRGARFSFKEAKMERKSFDVNVEVADGGRISGYASTFDRIPDSYGDIVAPGAFKESLDRWKESGLPIPLLFGHRTDDPFMNIGGVDEAGEDERGLFFNAWFDDENERAQYCRKLAKEKRIHQFSFAFDVLDEADVELDDGTKVRELRKLEIYEISLVPIPANPRATVEDVKSAAESRTAEPGEKAGRVLSRSNEDDLREAVQLIQGVLAKSEGDEPAASDEEEGDASAGKAGAKGALLVEQIEQVLSKGTKDES